MKGGLPVNNDQAYAYAQFTLCKFVGNGVITKEVMSDMLRELCFTFDVLGESEVIGRAYSRVCSLPEGF